jgi:hypothetical protein
VGRERICYKNNVERRIALAHGRHDGTRVALSWDAREKALRQGPGSERDNLYSMFHMDLD